MKPKEISKPQQERSVLISGNVFIYKAKAPYTASGKSIQGALEYDPADDTVMCHECGLWFKGLAGHLWSRHQMTAKEYKLRHGLKVTSGLTSEETRRKLIITSTNASRSQQKKGIGMFAPAQMAATIRAQKKARRSANYGKRFAIAEYNNLHKLCAKQVLDKIKAAAEAFGRAPKVRELTEYGVPTSAVRFHFGTHAEALRLAGLNGRIGNGQTYSDQQLLEMLRNVVLMKNRLPTRSDARRGLIAHQSTYVRRFGNWETAIKRAGYVPQRKYSQWAPPVEATA